MAEPFHEGEIALQERQGERPAAARLGKAIAGSLTPAARAFLGQQRLLAAATLGDGGRIQASLLFGSAGLASSTDGRTVTLDRGRLEPAAAGLPWSKLGPGSQLGLLAIDLGTRRRLRVNGAVSSWSEEEIVVAVVEAYPNCPKYIQRRRLLEEDVGPADTAIVHGESLQGCAGTLLQADTFFVASHHPARGLDASHRGGRAGFIQILDDRSLRIPDYPGNGMFNTLGNFAVSGAAGLLVPDFERRRILQLTGEASLPQDAGTLRHWDFHCERWLESPAPRTFRWELLEESPFNP